MNKTTTLIKLCAMTLLCALALTIFYPLIFLACAASASPVLHHSGAAQTLNTWDAWCWAVSPTTAKLYRNGAQVYSGAHSGLANPAGVSFRCAVGNGLGAPGDNDDGIRAHIDELVIVKGWAGDISGITSEIVL